MDTIHLNLYKTAKEIDASSNGEVQFRGFYDWLVEVKNVCPDIEKILLKKAHRKTKELQHIPTDSKS